VDGGKRWLGEASFSATTLFNINLTVSDNESPIVPSIAEASAIGDVACRAPIRALRYLETSDVVV